MSETIQARVLRVIATTQRIPLEKVKPDSTFEELGIDSMDSINILFDLESEFDIEIKDEDAKKIQTIREMIDGVTYLVDSKQNRSARIRIEPNPVYREDAEFVTLGPAAFLHENGVDASCHIRNGRHQRSRS